MLLQHRSVAFAARHALAGVRPVAPRSVPLCSPKCTSQFQGRCVGGVVVVRRRDRQVCVRSFVAVVSLLLSSNKAAGARARDGRRQVCRGECETPALALPSTAFYMFFYMHRAWCTVIHPRGVLPSGDAIDQS